MADGYNNAKLKSLLKNPKLNPYLRGLAEQIVGDIKLSMQEVSPGKTYNLYDPKRTHVASRPGDAPNIDKGLLVASIGWYQKAKHTMIIHDGVPYGIELEIGNANVAARPFVRPQFTKWTKDIAGDMKKQGIIS